MTLQVTPTAGAALANAKEQSELEDGQLMRLTPVEGQIAIDTDWPHDGDRVIEHEGEAVLAVDPTIDEQLTDHTIDVGSAGEQQGQLIIRPAG